MKNLVFFISFKNFELIFMHQFGIFSALKGVLSVSDCEVSS